MNPVNGECDSPFDTRDAVRMIEAKEAPVVFENHVPTRPDKNMAFSRSRRNKYVARSWRSLPSRSPRLQYIVYGRVLGEWNRFVK